ncbi:hypothetical protein G443_004764 [Actinoalloteichus cyanogriseus DSM 43889]|uniref:Uncharacterized protein n=1 Tax=Actinoalloteichus caeruleus DSM 43889 TaxID=1120930 RepID=A0ABT1JPP9_ACTCY|nr:hypothetical protein [Actinoalloteichus caeruleus DSM 43889]
MAGSVPVTTSIARVASGNAHGCPPLARPAPPATSHLPGELVLALRSERTPTECALITVRFHRKE